MSGKRILGFALLMCAACGWTLAASRSARGDEGWLDDVEKAMAVAKAENKDLLLDFTGSDWCVWCIKLDEEVFSKVEFKDAVPQHFVLVKLDFPQDNSGLSEETIAQNERWQKKLGVAGFPSIYLADAAGRPYAKTGYQEGGAAAYVPHLEELRKIRIARDQEFAAAEKAEGVERAKHLDAALSAIEPDPANAEDGLVMSCYGDVVQEIVKLDSDNSAGLRAKYNAARDAEQRREALAKIQLAAQTQRPEIGLRMIDQALTTLQFPDEMKLRVRQIKLQLLQSAGRDSEALTLLDELLADTNIDQEVHDSLIVNKVYSLVSAGKAADALALLDGMIEGSKEQRGRLCFTKGELLDRLGRYAEAVAAFDAATVAVRDDYELRHEAQLAKADSLASSDKLDESLALLDQIVADEKTPDYLKSDTLIRKALILRDFDRAKDAELAEQKAIEMAVDPNQRAEVEKLIEQLRRLGN